MGTGLSPLQKRILDVLPEYREEDGYIYEGMRVRTVLRALKLENTPVKPPLIVPILGL